MAYQKVVLESASNTIAQNTTGSAATLTNGRNFSIGGDGTASAVSFDGSGNVLLSLALAADCVAANEIADNAVGNAAMADNAIGNAEMKDDAIKESEIAGLTGGTVGLVVTSTGVGGEFAYGSALSDSAITLTGGTGLKTGGSFTLNQAAGEEITFDLDVAGLTAETSLAGDDTIPFYDESATAEKKLSLTSLGSKLAGTALSSSNGVLSVDLTSAGVISIAKDDNFYASDTSTAGALSKFTVANLGTFLAGTGLTGGQSDGSIAVDATQAITAVTGDFAIAGDLTVSGTTITTATETLEIADNKMLLNSDLTGGTAADTGMVVNRADATGDKYKMLFWDESKGGWCIGSHDTSSAFPATSSKLMVNVENDGEPSGSETTVGGMVYDTSANEMYIRTS